MPRRGSTIQTEAVIPMLADQLPSQRVHLVETLPPIPDSLICTCAFGKDLSEKHQPRCMPHTARFVAMVECAWGPMNSRLDAYYISTNRKRTHWILWARGLDEWGERLAPRETAVVYAYCLRAGISREAAAMHLLKISWEWESNQSNVEHFDWISQEGLLSVSKLEAVAREVWRN